MFYGWGRKTSEWSMPDGRTLVCGYRHISIMFVFKLAWGRTWHLIGRDRDMDVETSRAELERYYGRGQVPDIGLFERFGMVLTGAVVVGAVAVSAAAQMVFGIGSDTVATAASGSDEPVAVVVTGENSDDADDSQDPEDPNDSDDALSSNEQPEDGTGPQTGAESESLDEAEAATETTTADTSSQLPEGGLYEEAAIPDPVDDQRLVSTNITGVGQGWSELAVHRVYATTIFEQNQAATDEKYVVIEYQLFGVEGNANVFDTSFRLQADDGMTYSPTLASINDVIQAGQAINTVTVFTVPAAVVAFRFEVGVLEAEGDGFQSAYDLELVPTEQPPAPERWDGTWQTVSAEQTSDLTTFTGSALTPQQPALALEVRGGKTTAKIGPEAAAVGFKLLEVDVKVTGTGGPTNLVESAFRVTVDGEMYSPTNSVNELVMAGETWSGSLIFQIPGSATVVDFEAGVPLDWAKGSHAAFELVFADGPGS